MKQNNKQTRITIGLSPNQMQCLQELSEIFNTSYSQVIRMMVLDFLTRNDKVITKLLNEHDGIDTEDYGLSEEN